MGMGHRRCSTCGARGVSGAASCVVARRRCGVAALRPAAAGPARRRSSGRRRSSSIGTASRCTRRGRRAGSAASATRRRRRCRRRCVARRSRPRTCASARTRASIRSRSCARPWHNLRAGAIVEGGSTITQQVAKLLLARQTPGTAPRAAWRAKIREAVLALRLEHRLTKHEILALYLNLAPYGNQIAGRRARAQRVLRPSGVDADAGAGGVSRGAAAAAVALQPVARSPRPRGRAQLRILRAMSDRGWLDAPRDCAPRATSALTLSRDAARLAGAALRRARAARGAGTDRPRRIETTLDAGLQRDVAGHHRGAARRRSSEHDAANVAVVVLDNAHRRVAGLGRIGRLLRRGARRRRSTAS